MESSLMCFVWRWSVGALECDLYGVKTDRRWLYSSDGYDVIPARVETQWRMFP